MGVAAVTCCFFVESHRKVNTEAINNRAKYNNCELDNKHNKVIN